MLGPLHVEMASLRVIGLDHAHEQLNAQVKGNGGAIGLSEDPGAPWS